MSPRDHHFSQWSTAENVGIIASHACGEYAVEASRYSSAAFAALRAVFELWRRRVAGCNQRRGLVAVNHTHIMQQSHQCIGKQRLPVTHLAQPCPGDGFFNMTHASTTSASGGRLGLGREQLIHKVDIQDKQEARDVKGSTWRPFFWMIVLNILHTFSS